METSYENKRRHITPYDVFFYLTESDSIDELLSLGLSKALEKPWEMYQENPWFR